MKKYIFSFSVMLILIFFWWFTGGTLWGYVRPSPADKAFSFISENFNYGLAAIIEAFRNLIK